MNTADPAYSTFEEECAECGGTGRDEELCECGVCRGRGYLTVERLWVGGLVRERAYYANTD